MENVIYNYNVNNDSSDSSSDSSSTEFYIENNIPFFYPIVYPNYNYVPIPQIKPVKPIIPVNPIISDIQKPDIKHFDLSKTFDEYNTSMKKLVDVMNKVIRIYGFDKKYLIKDIPPIELDSYLFPVEQGTLDIINGMMANIDMYNKEYKKLLEHGAYLSQFQKDFERLKNTSLE